MKLTNYLLRTARHLFDFYMTIFRPVTPSVRILLVKDGKTLLIHHTYASKWYFPGGGVNRGETLMACGVREAWEEVGAVVRGEPELLGIYYYEVMGRSDHVVVFVSEDFDLAPPPPSWEIAGRAWFDLEALPADMNRSCRQRIEEYLGGGAPHIGAW